ncbi:MAG: cytochrome c-type biogenesis protein CcmH [Candidatus Rokubacteria bacterium]|nr:cytochrome c-type biogenesis protein CcmH [Candidatus Rokubacteria bacterium]
MRKPRPWLILLLALAALALSGPAGAPRAEPALDDRVREIASGLRCPVCQNLSVGDSPSQMAQQMRAVIRERVVAGESREEIEAYFVSKYGEWILLSPRRRGLNLLLWLGPFAAAALGLLLAAYYVRRWTRRPAGTARRAPEPALLERVHAELADETAPRSPELLRDASPAQRELLRLYEALRELAFDHRAGKLSAEDYEAMRAEYEARAAAALLERDAEPQQARAGASGARRERRGASRPSRPGIVRWKPARTAGAAVLLLVFGVAVGFFLTRGLRPRGSSMDSLTGDFLTGTGPGGVSSTLSFSRNTVERNLAEGRAAFERGDYRRAIDHFKSMLEVDPSDPAALSYLGMILSRGGHAEAGLEAIDRALRTAPEHPLALWMKGLVLAEAKEDHAGAIQVWEALLRQPLTPSDADAVARLVTEARGKLAAPPGRISGTVSLAEGVRGEAPVAGTLFVIARRGAGAPVAVKRIVEPKFPVRFVLGPEDVMRQDARLAGGDLTLIARLKRDGRAGPAVPGDLEGAAPGPVAAGTTNARIALELVR